MWSAPPLIQRTPCFPHKPFTPTISKNFRLYSQFRNLDLGTNSISGSVIEQDKMKSRAKHKQQGAKQEEEEKKLSGLNILRALERATVQKMKKKNKERNGSVIGSNGRQERKDDEALEEYGNKNVRALNIKEDWGTRLDELETRLQALLDTTTAA